MVNANDKQMGIRHCIVNNKVEQVPEVSCGETYRAKEQRFIFRMSVLSHVVVVILQLIKQSITHPVVVYALKLLPEKIIDIFPDNYFSQMGLLWTQLPSVFPG